MQMITATYNTGLLEFTIEMTIDETVASINECIEDATEFNDGRMLKTAKAQLAWLEEQREIAA